MDIKDFTAAETNAWNCDIISFRFFAAKICKILPCNVNHCGYIHSFGNAEDLVSV